MDLGTFQPVFAESEDTNGDGGNTNGTTKKQSAVASWRLAPEESYSDWTVEILVTSDLLVHPTAPQDQQEDKNNDPKETDGSASADGPKRKKRRPETAVYHVHKERLGTGPRSSLYFAKLFRSEFVEASKQKSTVSFPMQAAECFPDLLDFIYSDNSGDVKVDSPASAVAMRYLANYFGMKELFDNVNSTFISWNMSTHTVIEYVHESMRYGDESLEKAATVYLIKAISNLELRWTDAMASLPLSLIFEVAEKVDDRCRADPIIMKYIKSNEDRLTSEHVATLLADLDNDFVESCPFVILHVVERYKLPADHPARQKCMDTIGSDWYELSFDLTRPSDEDNSDSSLYAALSDAQKVAILERSLAHARSDLDDERARTARKKKKDKWRYR